MFHTSLLMNAGVTNCTVKFENDHVAKILGYGDYQIGNVTISRVYHVEGLGHNLFFVGKFCDSQNLEVLLTITLLSIRDMMAVLMSLIKGSYTKFPGYGTTSVSSETLAKARVNLQNVPKSKATRTKKKLYFDELTMCMGVSEHSSSGPALHDMTPTTISSGLVPNPPPSTLFVPPSRSDWDLFVFNVFDEELLHVPLPAYADVDSLRIDAKITRRISLSGCMQLLGDRDLLASHQTRQKSVVDIHAFNVSEDTLNRFKMRGFGSLLEAGTEADTKHDIGPTCR
ncbi:hypothetical protein Tco_0701137 [Tanacetum coccineum]